MEKINYIKWINDYLEIIEKCELPVDDITSINKNGEFTIEICTWNDNFSSYTGKVINDGLVAIKHSEDSYSCGMEEYDKYILNILIVRNIDGYSFTAINQDNKTEKNYDQKVKSNELKIKSLYSHYDVIIEALKNGTSDKIIKEEFKMNYFESSSTNSKTKQL